MYELLPNRKEGAFEKHIPVVSREGNVVTVKVGSVEHPMTPEHFIQWICLQTKNGNQRKMLRPSDKPEASFMIFENDEIEAVYEYCNLHGLWKNED
jgi:superoxide reductase